MKLLEFVVTILFLIVLKEWHLSMKEDSLFW
jgi:hypothetical protein